MPLYQQNGEETIYIPRDAVRKALKYNGSGQLAKMQSKYDSIFQTEYIRDFTVEDDAGNITEGVGLYTLRGVIEVCAHTQKFRGASVFLDFLKKELSDLGVKTNFPEILQAIPFSRFEQTERELLMQMTVQLAKIQQILEHIATKLDQGEKKNETDC